MVNTNKHQKYNKILSNWYSNYKPISYQGIMQSICPNTIVFYNGKKYSIKDSYLNNNPTAHIHKKNSGACFKCWIIDNNSSN
jgi:hypothetical protein